jgi:hypothetical protein
MKAAELQIGDWVYNTYNRKPEQVCEIREHMVMLAYNDLYDYDEIEPIPLTSEILEQNGFWRVPQPGCANPYHWELEQRDEDGETLYKIVAYNTPFRGIFIQINNPCDCESISFCKQIEHVHELQHALRLCGIDKEIIIKED